MEAHVAGGVDNAVHDGALLQRGEGGPKDVQRREHGAKVFRLYTGLQVHFLKDAGRLVPQGGAHLIGKEKRAQPASLCLEDGCGLRDALPHQRGDAGLENPCLLPGNLLQRIAEQRHVVKADGSNHGEKRFFQDIGAVQAAAKARFDDGNVHPFVGKPLER